MPNLEDLRDRLAFSPGVRCWTEWSPRRLVIEVEGQLYLQTVRLLVEESPVGFTLIGHLGDQSQYNPAALSQALHAQVGPAGVFVDPSGTLGLSHMLLGADVLELIGPAVFGFAVVVEVGAQALDAFDAHETAQSDQGGLGPGTYEVGVAINPGLYRFTGYFARLGTGNAVIHNDNAHSGWGLMEVFESDDYAEVSDHAYPIAELPVVDPIGHRFREGTYLVGVDIPVGDYKITKPGGHSYVVLYDASWDTVVSQRSWSEVTVELSSDVFAIKISGLLEPI